MANPVPDRANDIRRKIDSMPAVGAAYMTALMNKYPKGTHGIPTEYQASFMKFLPPKPPKPPKGE